MVFLYSVFLCDWCFLGSYQNLGVHNFLFLLYGAYLALFFYVLTGLTSFLTCWGAGYILGEEWRDVDNYGDKSGIWG